jgi:PilZ domain-containing protein
MQAGPSAAHPARARHRHELRTLTYVTLDQANGGIVRNLSHDGIAVQAVAAVRPRQQLRVRFELRYPRLRVETRGEVVWSTFSGQCGIRFLDISPRQVRQIDEWIFGDLLQGLSIPWEHGGDVCIAPVSAIASRPAASRAIQQPSLATARTPVQPAEAASESESEALTLAQVGDLRIGDPGINGAEVGDADGLLISNARMRVIELRPPHEPLFVTAAPVGAVADVMPAPPRVELDWLSQPLSGRSLAWTVDTLVVTAALLLFALVFLSVTREPPKWPLAMTAGGAIVVGGLYWGFFKMFGGSSLGARLSRLAGSGAEEFEEAGDARFR